MKTPTQEDKESMEFVLYVLYSSIALASLNMNNDSNTDENADDASQQADYLTKKALKRLPK